MKTAEVKAALRRAYKPAEYALMWEVGNTTGHSVRRHADAVIMNLWPSRGLLIEGFEIKVSRPDWRRELDHPEKAEAIARFCDHWWIIAPEGIVQEQEVPALWGYKAVTEKGLIRTVKQAPKKEADAADRGFIAAMLRRSSEADSAEIDAIVNRRVAEARESMKEETEREIARRTRRADDLVERVAKLKEAGIYPDAYFGVDSIIADYQLGKKMREVHALTGLEHIANNLDKAVGALREAAGVLSEPPVKNNLTT